MSNAQTAYIGLGANLGSRHETLREAVRRLRDLNVVTVVSSLYETEPVGYTSQPSFLNAVVEMQTDLDAEPLIRALLEIEADLGRTRSFRNAPRTLDLDLLLLGGVVMDTETAQVPHPRLHERAFVLTPLAEIAPNAWHPVLRQTVQQLLDAQASEDGVHLVADPSWINQSAGDAETAEGRSGNPA